MFWLKFIKCRFWYWKYVCFFVFSFGFDFVFFLLLLFLLFCFLFCFLFFLFFVVAVVFFLFLLLLLLLLFIFFSFWKKVYFKKYFANPLVEFLVSGISEEFLKQLVLRLLSSHSSLEYFIKLGFRCLRNIFFIIQRLHTMVTVS